MANKTAFIILQRFRPKDHNDWLLEKYQPIEVLVGDPNKIGIEVLKRIDELKADPNNKLLEFNDLEVPVHFVDE